MTVPRINKMCGHIIKANPEKGVDKMDKGKWSDQSRKNSGDSKEPASCREVNAKKLDSKLQGKQECGDSAECQMKDSQQKS